MGEKKKKSIRPLCLQMGGLIEEGIERLANIGESMRWMPHMIYRVGSCSTGDP